MSEDQFNVLKEMVAHLAEHITTEVGALHEKIDVKIDSLRAELRAEMRLGFAETNCRLDMLERRQDKATVHIELLQIEVGEIRERLDTQYPQPIPVE